MQPDIINTLNRQEYLNISMKMFWSVDKMYNKSIQQDGSLKRSYLYTNYIIRPIWIFVHQLYNKTDHACYNIK